MNTELLRNALRHMRIKGWKSIADCDLQMGALNVLIGANGAGKSNLLGAFRFMGAVADGRMQYHVGQQGGPDALLRFGRTVSPHLMIELAWDDLRYEAAWGATADNRLLFAHEECSQEQDGSRGYTRNEGHGESIMSPRNGHIPHLLSQRSAEQIRAWRTYHFRDTSETATLKRINPIDDHAYLRPDAENLAAFLYRLRLQHLSHYRHIVEVIRLVAPFFGDFILEPELLSPSTIQLKWQHHQDDRPFQAFQLSDGTLRFICLVTLLLQPEVLLPKMILLDEPELGLHPSAIDHLAGMLHSVSTHHQIIITTQSVELLNRCDPEEVIVADRDREGATSFKRLDRHSLESWLEEYTLGQLWLANQLGGRPA